MKRKSVPPSPSEVAFDCPHCGAYTTHTWYDLYGDARSAEHRAPGVPDPGVLKKIASMSDLDAETKERFTGYFQKLLSGAVFFEKQERASYLHNHVRNLHLSKCFNCDEASVWVHGRVLFPSVAQGPPPNPDLPQDVVVDYDEGSRVLGVSPRSAASLLRLAIQKLCIALGEKGKRIDDDIASLVKKGLSPVIQQALDSVRVIGNEAVHPGTLDLRDDVETASKLFGLVNIIAEQLITNPKHVKELYDKLPPEKREAIDKRDGRS